MSLPFLRPWDGMVGEAFDLLRMLPDRAAFVVFGRVMRKAKRKPIIMALGLLVGLMGGSIWILSELAGLLLVWKIVVEALVHLAIVLPLHRLYLRLRARQLAPLLEAELLDFAEGVRDRRAQRDHLERGFASPNILRAASI